MNLAELTELLDEAVVRGRSIGLGVGEAAITLDDARRRIGLNENSFVVALVGGTGVGKSSILNALAGTMVSEASVLRPTTEQATAWVGHSSRGDLEPLLDWLDIDRVVEHPDGVLPGVAIVDLPDIDSVVTDHRQLVDKLLPRIDLVIWVVDPEKYDDERLHQYLRSASSGGGGLQVILNKVDQLSEAELSEVIGDLQRRLKLSGFATAEINQVSAATGQGLADFRNSLEQGADAKQVILSKVRSEVRRRMGELASAAGVAAGEASAVGASDTIKVASGDATAAAIDIVDPEGLALQLRNLYMERARIGAGSLLSRIGTLARYVGGHRRRHADPKTYLLNWRRRGDIGRAVNPVRAAYLAITLPLSPDGRAHILSEFEPEEISRSMSEAIDRSVRATARDLEDPPAWLMWILAPLQWIATIGFIFALAWYVLVIFGPGGLSVDSLDLPLLGAVPTPLALLFVSALLSFLVGGLARLLAAWSSRRRGRILKATLRRELTSALDAEAFVPLRSIEENRAGLAILARRAFAD